MNDKNCCVVFCFEELVWIKNIFKGVSLMVFWLGLSFGKENILIFDFVFLGIWEFRKCLINVMFVKFWYR